MARDIPNPIFITKSTFSSYDCVIPGDIEPQEESILYKQIMRELLIKYPCIDPEFFYESVGLSEEFVGLNMEEHRNKIRDISAELFAVIRSILSDENMLVGLHRKLSVNFMDIMNCLYAYYGDLIIKKLQFNRCMNNIISRYSEETRQELEIDVRKLGVCKDSGTGLSGIAEENRAEGDNQSQELHR